MCNGAVLTREPPSGLPRASLQQSSVSSIQLRRMWGVLMRRLHGAASAESYTTVLGSCWVVEKKGREGEREERDLTLAVFLLSAPSPPGVSGPYHSQRALTKQRVPGEPAHLVQLYLFVSFQCVL